LITAENGCEVWTKRRRQRLNAAVTNSAGRLPFEWGSTRAREQQRESNKDVIGKLPGLFSGGRKNQPRRNVPLRTMKQRPPQAAVFGPPAQVRSQGIAFDVPHHSQQVLIVLGAKGDNGSQEIRSQRRSRGGQPLIGDSIDAIHLCETRRTGDSSWPALMHGVSEWVSRKSVDLLIGGAGGLGGGEDFFGSWREPGRRRGLNWFSAVSAGSARNSGWLGAHRRRESGLLTSLCDVIATSR